MPSLFHTPMKISGKRTFKCKNSSVGLRFYISRNAQKAKTTSSHSLPWAPKGKFSIIQRNNRADREAIMPIPGRKQHG